MTTGELTARVAELEQENETLRRDVRRLQAVVDTVRAAVTVEPDVTAAGTAESSRPSLRRLAPGRHG